MEDIIFWLALIGISYLLVTLSMFCGQWVDWLEDRFSAVGKPSGIRYAGYVMLRLLCGLLTILCFFNLVSLLIMWLNSKLTGFALASQEKVFKAKCAECIKSQINDRNIR
mgnify:CR=1 FL=1